MTNFYTFNGALNDAVTGYTATGYTYQYVSDRLGSTVNAVYLVNSYISLPDLVYFDGDFTISVWVYLLSYASWSRILDCYGASHGDNVIAAFTAGTTGLLDLTVTNYANGADINLYSSAVLPLNQWTHLAFTLEGLATTIYMSGVVTATGTVPVAPRSVSRPNCFIGRSYAGGDAMADAYVDEFRIFSTALSLNDINIVMNTYFF